MLLLMEEWGVTERVLLDPAAIQACGWCQGLGQVLSTPQPAQGHQRPVPSLLKLAPTGHLSRCTGAAWT